jgi:hypothetical protein
VLRGAGLGSLVTASRPAACQLAVPFADILATGVHTCMHIFPSSHQAAADCGGGIVLLLYAGGTVLRRRCSALAPANGSDTRCQRRCLLGVAADAASPLQQHGHGLDKTITTQATVLAASASCYCASLPSSMAVMPSLQLGHQEAA